MIKILIRCIFPIVPDCKISAHIDQSDRSSPPTRWIVICRPIHHFGVLSALKDDLCRRAADNILHFGRTARASRNVVRIFTERMLVRGLHGAFAVFHRDTVDADEAVFAAEGDRVSCVPKEAYVAV